MHYYSECSLLKSSKVKEKEENYCNIFNSIVSIKSHMNNNHQPPISLAKTNKVTSESNKMDLIKHDSASMRQESKSIVIIVSSCQSTIN